MQLRYKKLAFVHRFWNKVYRKEHWLNIGEGVKKEKPYLFHMRT